MPTAEHSEEQNGCELVSCHFQHTCQRQLELLEPRNLIKPVFEERQMILKCARLTCRTTSVHDKWIRV